MATEQTRRRPLIIAALAAVIVVGILVVRPWSTEREEPSVRAAAGSAVGSNTDLTSLPKTVAAGSAQITNPDPAANIGSAAPPYPVVLDELRARTPGNRFWALGAPTSDPAVAKQRAARAEADNAQLGRITANEATPDEIRAYYAERKAVSQDYLEITELILKENADKLPERDLGAFQLSANLHRDRMKQIDRDQADALARLAAKTSPDRAPASP